MAVCGSHTGMADAPTQKTDTIYQRREKGERARRYTVLRRKMEEELDRRRLAEELNKWACARKAARESYFECC